MLLPLSLLAATAAVALGAQQPTVTLPDTGAILSGFFQTNMYGNQVQTYQGIPYAEPRVGKQRFTQSKLNVITTNLNATSHGSICYGNPRLDAASGQYPPSEDCLFLNVYAPAGADQTSKLPVMVWIHGGGFIAGAANPYNGMDLVANGDEKVVIVTLNYRLSVFGFLANQELMDEGQGVNYGMRDQELAFAWVKKYIAGFGGNPNDLTAFGESAGAMAVSLLLRSRDGNQQFFQKAIMQSGYRFDDATSADKEASKATIAKALGCAAPTMACLRNADAATLFKVADAAGRWSPTVDKVFLLDTPLKLLHTGKFSNIPTISGTNTDEGWYQSGGAADPAQFDTFLQTSFPTLSALERTKLKQLYPASDFPTSQMRGSEMSGDRLFVCPSEKISQYFSQANPVFRYRFNQTSNEYGRPLVVHAKDLDFVFHRVVNPPAGLPDDASKTASVYFMKYWTNFARFGNPNGKPVQQQQQQQPAKLLTWPKYDALTQQQIILQEPLKTETSGAYTSLHAARCAFWNELEMRETWAN